MASSGTYDFALPVSDVVIEAFDRCEIRGTALTRNHILSARRSVNLELIEWSNRGVNLWEVKPFTIQIVAGQATYVAGSGVANISPNTVSMLDVYYSLIDGGGSGINTDRPLLPIGETDYAQIPNKLMQGQPTTFWYQKRMTGSQQITFWQVPNVSYPTAAISGFYLSRIQDAGVGSGETPDVPYLALDALCAKLAARLAVKFAKPLLQVLVPEAERAWDLFAETDREDAPVQILPAVGYLSRNV